MCRVMELVTGATGYIGGRLVRRLAREGRAVRALARTPGRLEAVPGAEPAGGDLITGRGLEEALAGCHTAYYLVHSMEAATSNGEDFAAPGRRGGRELRRGGGAPGGGGGGVPRGGGPRPGGAP